MRIVLALGLILVSTQSATAIDPLFFYEENIGQDAATVRYRIQGASQPAYLTANAVSIDPPLAFGSLQLRFSNTASPAIRSLERWPGILNRFTGAPAAWRRRIPAHRRVQYSAVQLNVDAIFGESGGIPTLTFAVQPGGDLSALFLEATPATTSRLDPQTGGWTIGAPLVSWTIAKPRAWQQQGSTQSSADVRFRLISNERAGFDLTAYDRTRALFIELQLPIAATGPRTYQGAKDPAGNTFVATGLTSTALCFVNTGGGRVLCPDAAAAGIRPDGEPIFLSVLAGRFEDSTTGRPVFDSDGNLVIAGNTGSDDFPVTLDALQLQNAGRLGPLRQFGPEYINGDAFLSVLNAVNGDLVYSTFYGGPDPEYPIGLLGGAGSKVTILALVNRSFPTTPGAWRPTPESLPSPPVSRSLAHQAAFQFDTSRKQLLFATFIPEGLSVRVAGQDGSLYITGSQPVGALTTEGSLQPSFGGGTRDGYLLRLAPNGARPVYATYYGGPLEDSLGNVIVDQQGDLWIAGAATSGDGTQERDSRYLLHVRADGTSLLSAPALLPHLNSSFQLADDGNLLYLADPAFTPVRAGCGTAGARFLQAYTPDGSLHLAAYLPPSAMADLNQIYLDTLARYNQPPPTSPNLVYVSGAAYRGNKCHVSPGQIVSLFGFGLGPEIALVGSPAQDGLYPTNLGTVRVLVNGTPAPLLYVHSLQINAVIPFSTAAGGPATITVEYQARQASMILDAVPAAFSLFAHNAEGSGPAATLNQDGTLNSESNPALRGTIVVVFGTGGGVTFPASRDGGLAPITSPELLPKPAGTATVLLLRTHPAEVLYAGAAPGQINGLTQVNLRIPADLPLDGLALLPVDIAVGGASSENTAKVWVK